MTRCLERLQESHSKLVPAFLAALLYLGACAMLTLEVNLDSRLAVQTSDLPIASVGDATLEESDVEMPYHTMPHGPDRWRLELQAESTYPEWSEARRNAPLFPIPG